MKKLLTLAFCLGILMPLWGQKTLLRYNLSPGHTYASNTWLESVINQSVMDMNIDMGVIMDMNISYTVISASADVYELEVRYTRISQEINSDYGYMHYSSDNPDEEAGNRMLKGMTESSFRMKMSPRGEVLEISGLDDMAESVASAMTGDEAEKETYREQIRQSFGGQEFRRSFGMTSSVFPEHPVGLGDKWTSEGTVSSNGMELDMSVVYEYRGIEDGCWMIHATGNVSTPSGSTISAEGIEMEVDISGEVHFEMWIDPATGWPEKVNGEMPMEGNMKAFVSGYGDMVIDMAFHMSIESNRIEQ